MSSPIFDARMARGQAIAQVDIYVLIIAIIAQGMYETIKGTLAFEIPWFPSLLLPFISTLAIVGFLFYIIRLRRNAR